jgi:hypothetical protein
MIKFYFNRTAINFFDVFWHDAINFILLTLKVRNMIRTKLLLSLPEATNFFHLQIVVKKSKEFVVQLTENKNLYT